MKKIMKLLLFSFICVLSFGATEKNIYLMMPESIDMDNLTSYSGGQTDVRKIEKGDMVIYGMVSEGELQEMSAEKINGYDDKVQVIKVWMKGNKDDAQIKIAMSYKVEDEERYIILADNDVKESTIEGMEENYKENNYSSQDLIDPSNDKSNYTYDTFPGYEIVEDARVFNIIIGSEKISKEGRVNPSNIIEKFGTGDEILGEGLNINPGEGINEFMIEDTLGNVLTMGDFKDGSIGTHYETSAEHLKFKIKSNPRTIYINGEAETLKTNQAYDFYNIDYVKVWNVGNGNGHWYLTMSGDNIVIGSDEAGEEFSPEEVDMDNFFIETEDSNFLILYDKLWEKNNGETFKVLTNPDLDEKEIPQNVSPDDLATSSIKYEKTSDTRYTFYDGPIKRIRFNYKETNQGPPVSGFETIEKKVSYKYIDMPRLLLQAIPEKYEGGDPLFKEDGEYWFISFPGEVIEVEEVVVIAGKGDAIEASIEIKSGEDRERISNVKVEILESGESGFEIESIKE